MCVFTETHKVRPKVPVGARAVWAERLIHAVRHVSFHHDERAWLQLFALPKMVLGAPSSRGGANKRKGGPDKGASKGKPFGPSRGKRPMGTPPQQGNSTAGELCNGWNKWHCSDGPCPVGRKRRCSECGGGRPASQRRGGGKGGYNGGKPSGNKGGHKGSK